MSVPGAEGDNTTCPVCDSERTEEHKAASGIGELSYQCLDCDAEFDDTGARIDL
jgi:transposase-like protein